MVRCSDPGPCTAMVEIMCVGGEGETETESWGGEARKEARKA